MENYSENEHCMNDPKTSEYILGQIKGLRHITGEVNILHIRPDRFTQELRLRAQSNSDWIDANYSDFTEAVIHLNALAENLEGLKFDSLKSPPDNMDYTQRITLGAQVRKSIDYLVQLVGNDSEPTPEQPEIHGYLTKLLGDLMEFAPAQGMSRVAQLKKNKARVNVRQQPQATARE